MAFTADDFLADAADLVERHRTEVREDLEAIPGDRIWERPVPGMVSAANLVLHLTGNLRHFFGHHLAGTDYERKRDREFEDAARAGHEEILERWDEACVETRTVLLSLDHGSLTRPAPVDTYPGGGPVHAYIVRLLGHLTYHAGQIRMLRRLLAPRQD
jgi:hypothetical protein